MIRLTAADGHQLFAYLAQPKGRVRGGLVVGQEMYGVNDYLRSVCDFYAEHGYLAIAPSLYDRKQRGLTFDYTDEGHSEAQRTYKSWDLNAALEDLDAGHAAVTDAGKIGFVGFCWGGTLAWLAACRKRYDGTVAYYGSWMPDFAGETARCQVIAHIGDRDNTLPLEKIASFRKAQPSVPVYMYPGAQHGFDNASRAARYDAAAHTLARERTLAFLAQHVG
jgi:carboxymethylenebutenolidase